MNLLYPTDSENYWIVDLICKWHHTYRIAVNSNYLSKAFVGFFAVPVVENSFQISC